MSSPICIRCHRPLKNPASVINGMGPICWAKHQSDLNSKSAAGEGHQDTLPGNPRTEGLIVKRKGDKLFVNVPHRLIKHSPTGFEIGYGGSGPADLALNTLLCFTDEKTAMSLHQEFKREFIATMEDGGGTISAETIQEWVKNNKAQMEMSI